MYEALRIRVECPPIKYIKFYIRYYLALGVVIHGTSKPSEYASKESPANIHQGRNLL